MLSFSLYSFVMRIIRFIAPDGTIHAGEDHQDGSATLLEGSIETGFTRTSQRMSIKKILAPVVPNDIICIGRNYRAVPHNDAAPDERPHASNRATGRHREEDGGDAGPAATEPDSTLEVFLKPSTAIQNPGDPILMPRFDDDLDPQLDCEGELAVIIGRETRNVTESNALRHVFGFTIANDVTARAFQTRSANGPPIWMRGKGFDTFLPIGPAIITADEIADPQSIDLRTIINGQVVRAGNTCQMIRTIPQVIAALSRHLTLRPGTLIITGAPVAQQSSLITAGCAVEIEIPPIGRLSNSIV